MGPGDVCPGGCDFPGLAFPLCRRSCAWGAGHLGRCACGAHALDPFVVPSHAAGWSGPPPGRSCPDSVAAHGSGLRATAPASAPEPLAVALHRRGLADRAPALRKAGFSTFHSLLDADPARLASLGIPRAELGEQEPSSSLALVPVRPASRSPRRSDLPVVAHTTRGSRAAVSAALATEHRRQAALRKLDSDVYANSSRAPRDSLWATWVFVAAAWGVPPIPVTEDTVRKVAAGLKAGGYRVPEQYFSRARQEHLRQVGSPIDAAAEQAIADCSRSVTRGIGPSSLKHSFPFEDLAPRVAWPEVAQLATSPPDGPLFPSRRHSSSWAAGGFAAASSSPQPLWGTSRSSRTARRSAWPSQSARRAPRPWVPLARTAVSAVSRGPRWRRCVPSTSSPGTWPSLATSSAGWGRTRCTVFHCSPQPQGGPL